MYGAGRTASVEMPYAASPSVRCNSTRQVGGGIREHSLRCRRLKHFTGLPAGMQSTSNSEMWCQAAPLFSKGLHDVTGRHWAGAPATMGGSTPPTSGGGSTGSARDHHGVFGRERQP